MPDFDILRRVDLADVHAPKRLARMVLDTLGSLDGSVPVIQVAKALDVSAVRIDRFDGFEGMLLTDRRRTDGVILANNTRGDRRARFTVAHELGHFLMERHVPSEEGGFRCTVADMRETREVQRHFRQEKEANRFAIELLAPKAAFDAWTYIAPDLDHVRRLSTRLDLSKEATARRYSELHEARVAMVFHRNGTVRYVDRPSEFTDLSHRKHSPIPSSIEIGLSPGTVSEVETADPKDWFDAPPMADLSVQTLYQNKGYAITMLTLDDEDPDGDGVEDTVDRYSRWGGGSL